MYILNREFLSHIFFFFPLLLLILYSLASVYTVNSSCCSVAAVVTAIVVNMSYLYHVYAITFTKPDRELNDPFIPHEGLLLAPACISKSSGLDQQLYLIQYHGQKEPTSSTPGTKIQRPRLPGVFGNCPTDAVQTALYMSVRFPVSHFKLIGVSHDLYAFCRTAKTIAKYNIGSTFEARSNWMRDTILSVTNQGIYKTLEMYTNQLKEEETRKYNRMLAGINRRVSSSLSTTTTQGAKKHVNLLQHQQQQQHVLENPSNNVGRGISTGPATA